MLQVGKEGKLYIFMKKYLKMKSVQKNILRYVRPSRPAAKKIKKLTR